MKRIYFILLGLIVMASTVAFAYPAAQEPDPTPAPETPAAQAVKNIAVEAENNAADAAAADKAEENANNADTDQSADDGNAAPTDSLANVEEAEVIGTEVTEAVADDVLSDSLLLRSSDLAVTIVNKVIAMSQQKTDTIAVDSVTLAKAIAGNAKMIERIAQRDNDNRVKNFVSDSTAIARAVLDSLQQVIHYQSMVDCVADGVVILDQADYLALQTEAKAPKDNPLWMILAIVAFALVLILVGVIVWLCLRNSKGGKDKQPEAESLVSVSKPMTATVSKSVQSLSDFFVKNK